MPLGLAYKIILEYLGVLLKITQVIISFLCLELRYFLKNNLWFWWGAFSAQTRKFHPNCMYIYKPLDLYVFCVIFGNR